MILALLIGLPVIAVVLATQAARPAASRRRAKQRRSRFIAAHPLHVNAEDIIIVLRRDGMSPERARSVTVRARVLGITPFTMWLWCERFGSESLGLVVAADLAHQDLLMHLCTGTAPAMDEARVFASANGWEPAGTEELAPVSVLRPYVFGRSRRAA